MSSLIQSIKNGEKQCCGNSAHFEIIYKNNEIWHVCESCFKNIPWNRFIKKKIIINQKCDAD